MEQQNVMATYAARCNLDPAEVVRMMAETMVSTMEKTLKKKMAANDEMGTGPTEPLETCLEPSQTTETTRNVTHPGASGPGNMGTIVLVEMSSGKEVHSLNAATHPEPERQG